MVVFCILDAFFTLHHLGRGAIEGNPLMRAALSQGTFFFYSLKTGMTALGVIFLALHQQLPLSWHGLNALTVAYAALLGYHVSLCWHA